MERHAIPCPVFPIQCSVLKEKLDSLLKTLGDESQASSSLPTPPPTIAEETEDGDGAGSSCSPTVDRPVGSACPARPQIFRPREQLMLRANSLKKAIRQIIEHTEKGSWSLNNKVAFFRQALGTPDSRRWKAELRGSPQLVKRCLTRAHAGSMLERPIPGEGPHFLEGSCPVVTAKCWHSPSGAGGSSGLCHGACGVRGGAPLRERVLKRPWLLRTEVS